MIFIIYVLSGICMLLCFVYYRSANYSHQLQLQKNVTDEILQNLKEKEKKLENENKELKNELEQTLIDPITQVIGWQLFEDRLNYAINESERFSLPLAIVFIDIDDFKMINEALGYAAGDALLRQLAIRLQSCIRKVDSISRFNKDIFVVLLTQLTRPETAALVAQRILQAMMLPFQIANQNLQITVGIGIAIYPQDGKNAHTLLRNAEHALDLAKAQGKHSYQFYQQILHEKSHREFLLLNSLNKESVFEEFIIFYQTFFDVTNQSIQGVDALLYWQHPHYGIIDAEEVFIYLEKQRNANIYFEWLLNQVARQWLHWQTLGFSPPLISIAFSIKQLMNSHFIYRISQVLQELKFNPECLLLVIKDTVIEVSSERLKNFNMLKYLGVKIALDNFDANHIPLLSLIDIQIDYIKLSPSLCKDIDQSPQKIALAKSILSLANNLSLTVIAQGVDTEIQKNKLQEIGVVLMQGKINTAPLLAEEMIKRLSVVS